MPSITFLMQIHHSKPLHEKESRKDQGKRCAHLLRVAPGSSGSHTRRPVLGDPSVEAVTVIITFSSARGAPSGRLSRV